MVDIEPNRFLAWKEFLENEDNIGLCLSIERSTWNPEQPAMLLLVRGAPGSGKSTFASVIAKLYDFKHYEADMFMMENGVYKFDKRKLGWAHGQCQEAVRRDLFINGENVVVSNTFTTQKELAPYIKMGTDAHYVVEQIILRSDFGSVHNVPRETVEKMRRRLED